MFGRAMEGAVHDGQEPRSSAGPELLSLLKGKSCFYIKELTPLLRSQIERVLKKGFELYQSRGWV